MSTTPEIFAARLRTPVNEDQWQTEWSRRVAEEMRANAPVRTGALRASIQPSKEGVRVGVPYGAYVEYGTAHVSPQPFAGPSVARLAKPAADDLGDRVIRQLT